MADKIDLAEAVQIHLRQDVLFDLLRKRTIRCGPQLAQKPPVRQLASRFPH